MPDDDATAGTFDDRTDAWASWQSAPWGRLRYAVAEHTTARALAGLGDVLRVIDVGGGDGSDAIPLARRGHRVTVLDFSAPLLAVARRRAAAEDLPLETVCADLDEATAPGGALRGRFDAVLCHNVLHYRADVDASVAALVALLRPGRYGVISVMAPNPAMDVLAAAVRRADPAAARAVLDAPYVHSETFGHDTSRLEAATVEAALVRAGCTVEQRFGIRCVMDLIADDDRKSDPDFYRQLEELELLLCGREPYWRTARFWQLIARRAG